MAAQDTERVYRRDDYQGATLAAPVEMANGWVRVEAKISRIGLQEYEDDDGFHMELRLPEHVFDPVSLASAQMVPVTDTHPPVLLDDTNTTTFQRGQAGENVRQLDDTWVAAPLMIIDRALKQKARNGEQNQISVGYTCKLKPTSQALIDKWGPHKYVQTEIVFNHIAFVSEARAGPEARARLDSRAAIMRNPMKVDSVRSPTERRMARLRIGKTLTLDMVDGNAEAIQSAIDREIADLQAKADSALGIATSAKEAAEKRASIILDNAKRILAKLGRVRVIVDAKKAMMASCDECGGTGKVTDDADATKSKTCDFCDGEGKFRMHSAIGGKAGAEADGDDPDGDLEEEMSEEEDADELEVEKETEAEAGTANKDRKDAKRRSDSRQKRRAAYDEQQKALAESRQRIMDRAIRARVELQDAARKVLGDDFDFSKVDTIAIKRKVVETLAPNAKLDGKSDAQIGERYAAAMEQFEASGADTVQAIDHARGSTVVVDAAPGRQEGAGAGAGLRGRAKFLARNDEIAKTGKFDADKWAGRK